MSEQKKIIVVFGATGAQGLAVIDALLAPQAGKESPYAIRALTRDLASKRARELELKGVELFQGSVEDFDAVERVLKGAYGAWVNTDGFTIGEKREMFVGIRIFEISKRVGLRHFVWSNLDYVSKIVNYDPFYHCGHYDGKGRVLEFIKAQESDASSDNGMVWSSITTGPYMEMLKIYMFGPVARRSDGTFVFASPIGDGHVPMIALHDLGFFARYSFDHRERVSGHDWAVASAMVPWTGEDGVIETFKRVNAEAGREVKAVFVRQTVEEWMGNFVNTDKPAAIDNKEGLSWKENFTGFWRNFRDDNIKRDMEWVKSIHPDAYTLERWMRENGYGGQNDFSLFNWQEGAAPVALAMEGRVYVNEEAVRKL